MIVKDADTSAGRKEMILADNSNVLVGCSKADNCGVFGIYIAKCGSGTQRECSTDSTNHGVDICARERIRLECCVEADCDQALILCL